MDGFQRPFCLFIMLFILWEEPPLLPLEAGQQRFRFIVNIESVGLYSTYSSICGLIFNHSIFVVQNKGKRFRETSAV
jgi:hypothetical protein